MKTFQKYILSFRCRRWRRIALPWCLLSSAGSVGFAQNAPNETRAKLSAGAPNATQAPVQTAQDAPATAVSEPASSPVDVAPVEVVIVGTPAAKTSGSTHVIRQKQLERFAHDDPHAVLQTIPGVYARGEDGIGLRPNLGIRGANSDRSKKLTLTEDGILFGPAPYSAPAAYYFPLMTRMVGLRVLKGPSAISFGPHSVGGAIDVQTRAVPSRASGALDLAGGQYGYGKLHAWYGASSERAGFLIEGARLQSSGFKELDGGGDTGFYRNEWMIKGKHVVDPSSLLQHEFALKLGYSDESSNETYLGLTDADFRATPLRRYRASQFDRMKWHRTQVELSHIVEIVPQFTLTTTVYRHDLSRTWNKVNGFDDADLSSVLADPSSARYAPYYGSLRGANDSLDAQSALRIGPNHRVFVSQGIQLTARVNHRGKDLSHRIEYGIRIHNDSVDRVHSDTGYTMSDGQLRADGRPERRNADNKASTLALAMHATDAITWSNLTFTPGFRVEALQFQYADRLEDSKNGNAAQVFLPGAGIFYHLTPRLGILAGVHRGFSPAPPGPRGVPTSPESSVNYEAGVRWLQGKFRAEAIGFYSDYSNLIDVCTYSSGCIGSNVDRKFDAGRAEILGLEAFVEHEIPVNANVRLPITGAYTYTWTQFLDSFVSENPQFGAVRAGDELPYVPRHQFSAMAALETTAFNLGFGATYVSSMKEQGGLGGPLEGKMTDSMLVLDASGAVHLAKEWEIYFVAKNLANAQGIASRRPFGARPFAPRWMQGGIRYKF